MKDERTVPILYFCDGNREECDGSPYCYKNGGECRATSRIEHAKNFIRCETEDEKVVYCEAENLDSICWDSNIDD